MGRGMTELDWKTEAIGSYRHYMSQYHAHKRHRNGFYMEEFLNKADALAELLEKFAVDVNKQSEHVVNKIEPELDWKVEVFKRYKASKEQAAEHKRLGDEELLSVCYNQMNIFSDLLYDFGFDINKQS